MDSLVAASALPEEHEAVQFEAPALDAPRTEAHDSEAASPGFKLYPIIGMALMLASAALACGGVLYVLKRAGVHLPR